MASPVTQIASGAAAPRPLNASNLLAPGLDELALLLLAVALGAVGLLLKGWWITTLNLVIPAVLMITMLRGAVAMLRQSVATVWTPLLWVRAAVFFYGGFGTVYVLTANDATRDYAEAFFSFFAGDVLKYNVTLALFALAALTVVRVFTVGRGDRAEGSGLFKLTPSSFDLSIIGGVFLVVGAMVLFVFIVPFQFGWVNTTFPAVLGEISQMSLIGIFLSAISFARRRSPMLVLVIGVGLTISFTGLMAFSKLTFLMPIIMLLLAYFYLKPTLARAALMAATILSALYFSAPLVDQGRYLMIQRYGGLEAPVPVAERAEMLRSYFDPLTEGSGDEAINYAALRLSYVNVGTFVIAAHDSGQTGTSYKNIGAIFIPRLIWKDKPIITEVARQLSYNATGNFENSVAPGLAPEAYWNGGWPMVILIGAVFGTIVYFWSVYAISVQVAGAWHLFPVVLLGARVGSRFDGFLVVDVIGPIAFAVVAHLLISLGNIALQRRGAQRMTPA